MYNVCELVAGKIVYFIAGAGVAATDTTATTTTVTKNRCLKKFGKTYRKNVSEMTILCRV